MGLLDHRRQWNFELDAKSQQCIEAFERAFTGRASPFRGAKWDLSHDGGGAVAVYRGRSGLDALLVLLSSTASHEQETALGSEVKFVAEPSTPEGSAKTQCSMWLSQSGRAGISGALGATADARFIRPYMQSVGRELLGLDPTMRTSSS